MSQKSAGSGRGGDPEHGVQMVWGAKIPMRDGVKLNATVYIPTQTRKALPAIFTLTPYTADTYHERAFYFSRNGYVFALVDVRGRGNSEGRFEPFAEDGKDGYDVVEWLARQPWCNGKVAMWGGSYAGYNQWATLCEFPPHLETIVPAAAACPGVDFPSLNGINYSYEMQWLTLTSGVTANFKIWEDPKFWIGRFQEQYLRNLPFKDLDSTVSNPSPHFQEWLKHAAPQDPYWEKKMPEAEHFRKVSIPVLTITGHYDDDQPGAMHYYKMHMRHGSAKARARHYLLMGPWNHPGTRTPAKEFAGLKLADAAVVDLNRVHKEWYDWTLKDGKLPDFLKKRVTYYMTGAETWNYSDNLDSISTTRWRLYLGSNNSQANDVFHSGTLSEKLNQTAPDSYTYDPLDLRPADMEREEFKDSLVDQRYALNLFGSGLVYHTAPFPQAEEIVGYVKLNAWISMDVPDTDFIVSLWEIMSNGAGVILTYDGMRARYRESLKQEKLAKPGEVNRYEFDKFLFFGRRVGKRSRLRLVVQTSNSIYWEKNYNSGGDVAKESKKDARTAHITLHHDTKYPSALELPVRK